MNTHHSGKDFRPYLETLGEWGFCTFPVFDGGEVEQLRTLYEKYFRSHEMEGLRATHNSGPVEHSLAISREIETIVGPALRGIFQGYDYFVGHFMVKGSHTSDEFCLHQDWDIVDETRHKSYQVWIPLQMTYPANGGMFVVPGSHRFFGNHRSGSYGIPYIPFDGHVEFAGTDLIVPPGHVLVYHNALFHGSYPNTTDDLRIAVIVNFVEKGAPTYYHHKNTETGLTDRYAITGETLVRNLPVLEKGGVPDLLLTDSIALCSVLNRDIHSQEVEAQYRRLAGNLPASQQKQLHITRNTELEQELSDKGYAVIDLLNGDEVAVFRAEYERRFGNLERTPGRFTTLQHTDAVLKKQVHEFIVVHVNAPMQRFFRDFTIPVSQFYTKKAFTSGDIDLHADSTLLLNHQAEPHYAVWVPLLDVDASNGTLTVIPGSHKVRGAFFGGTVGGYHREHLPWLKQLEVPVVLKAGQAVVFDNNLLHNSTANGTAVDRVCFTFRVTHMLSTYYSLLRREAGEDAFDVYEEDHGYYMADHWDGDNENPSGRYRGTIKNSLNRIPKHKLEKLLGCTLPTP